METEVKKRAWVKDVAIVFLVILLLLTFFSRTILNASLTEVATQEVTNGTITAKVRGTGKVVANGSNKVKAPGTVTVAKVMVKTGEEVSTGDVLFVLGPGDSTELETAKNTLFDLQVAYDSAVANLPLTGNYVREQNEVSRLGKILQTARAELEVAKANRDAASEEGKTQRTEELISQKTKTENALNEKVKELDALKLEANSRESSLTNAKISYTDRYSAYLEKYGLAPGDKDDQGTEFTEEDMTPEQKSAWDKVVEAQNLVADVERNYNSYMKDPEKGGKIVNLQYEVDVLEEKLDTINDELARWSWDTDGEAEYKEKLAAYEDAQRNYENAVADLNSSMAYDGKSLNSAYISVQAAADKVERQKQKIAELSGEGEEKTINATVGGTVTEVNCSSGDTVAKDDILAVVEVSDMGYTVSFSVTNDQARRLKVGDEGTVSNFYWGNNVNAKLISIATDKTNPQSKKVLTFDLEGNVTTGSELTVSVGQKSANYDLIIPNSAIRNDNNGSFVLALVSKNSPLGNKYIARRVSVEVLAEDDTNSAVTGDLKQGDFVITTSTAPISSGEQVRLADNIN